MELFYALESANIMLLKLSDKSYKLIFRHTYYLKICLNICENKYLNIFYLNTFFMLNIIYLYQILIHFSQIYYF